MNCHTIQKPRNTSRVVVMEGPDACGKTNIGQGIALALAVPYFRMRTQHENWRNGSLTSPVSESDMRMTKVICLHRKR